MEQIITTSRTHPPMSDDPRYALLHHPLQLLIIVILDWLVSSSILMVFVTHQPLLQSKVNPLDVHAQIGWLIIYRALSGLYAQNCGTYRNCSPFNFHRVLICSPYASRCPPPPALHISSVTHLIFFFGMCNSLTPFPLQLCECHIMAANINWLSRPVFFFSEAHCN